MLTFELTNTKEGIEIYFDETGIDDLIRYLQFIKKNQDHYHLLAGNELDEKLINQDNSLIKQVTLYCED